ncbi:MAG: hypothetical protein NTZ44_03640 [Candidatus Nomurabacteria bacterium]|nr:hypothetical protein [Candidatus Nomurabacteria bacterium]
MSKEQIKTTPEKKISNEIKEMFENINETHFNQVKTALKGKPKPNLDYYDNRRDEDGQYEAKYGIDYKNEDIEKKDEGLLN